MILTGHYISLKESTVKFNTDTKVTAEMIAEGKELIQELNILEQKYTSTTDTVSLAFLDGVKRDMLAKMSRLSTIAPVVKVEFKRLNVLVTKTYKRQITKSLVSPSLTKTDAREEVYIHPEFMKMLKFVSRVEYYSATFAAAHDHAKEIIKAISQTMSNVKSIK